MKYTVVPFVCFLWFSYRVLSVFGGKLKANGIKLSYTITDIYIVIVLIPPFSALFFYKINNPVLSKDAFYMAISFYLSTLMMCISFIVLSRMRILLKEEPDSLATIIKHALMGSFSPALGTIYWLFHK